MNIPAYLGFLLARLRGKKEVVTDYAASVVEIDYTGLQKKGVKLLLFDVDDTLTEHHGPFTPDIRSLLDVLGKSFTVCLLSNASKKRLDTLKVWVADLSVQIELPKKDKPSTLAYLAIMEKHNVKGEECAAIGDRSVTDLWGAYKMGIKHRILVEPYSKAFHAKTAPVPLRWLRGFEKRIAGG